MPNASHACTASTELGLLRNAAQFCTKLLHAKRAAVHASRRSLRRRTVGWCGTPRALKSDDLRQWAASASRQLRHSGTEMSRIGACPERGYEADPTKSGLDKVAAKSFGRAGWALATATSRSRSSRRPHRDRHRRGSRPYSPFPHTQLSRLLSLLALAWQVSVMPSRCRRLLAATRCPHLSPALHQPSPENLNDFHLLCVWRQQVWQH